MNSYLPESDGWLPLYVLIMGVTAVANAAQSYATLSYTRRLYAGQPATTSASNAKASKGANATAQHNLSPVTPLSSRTFGTWTLGVGIVRMYAAYHMNEPAWYQLQMWVTALAFVHFNLEAFVYKTAKPSGPWLAPVLVATTGLVWSTLGYNYYVKP